MAIRNFFVHLHPPFVTRRALSPLTTLGFGIITLVLFGVLTITGVLLMIYYVPTFQGALKSIHDIEYAVTFGSVIRAVHRFAGHAMVLFGFFHLLRVLLTGAYHKRTLNWGIGLVLFLLLLGLAFTGYLLPGDQLSYWAVVVSTNLLDHLPVIGGPIKRMLLGGEQIGDPAMIRFYALHVALLPLAMAALIAWHLWRIRKDGGLAFTPLSEETMETVPASPHLTLREGVLAFTLLAILVLFSVAVTAPLGGAPDVHQPSNPEKTPWYFLFLQEMVSYSAPIGGFVFPLVLIVGLALVPILDRRSTYVGSWLGSRGERLAFLISFVSGCVVFAVLQWIYLRPDVMDYFASVSVWMRDLVNPATLMLLTAFVAMGAARLFRISRQGVIFAGAAVMLVAVIGFGVMGWCRGPGWLFYWPWEGWPNV